MTTTITKHQRGFFGRIWQVLFWLFQAAMVTLVVINLSAANTVISADCAGESACQAGAAIGSGLIAATGWFVWILGTIILGILMMATRGKLVTKQV